MGKKYNVLVIGANRGIGFELATHFLKRGHTVYGSYRPQSREDTSVTQLKGTGLTTVELDFTDESSIIEASRLFEGRPLDILVNCAALYYLWDDKPFTEMSADDLITHFKVNTVGPFLTSTHLLPYLTKAAVGKIINISSDMGSISDNNHGGNACYRVSKCALNQLTKTMALDMASVAPNVITLSVHPGFIATKVTGYEGPDDMESCVTALVHVVEAFGTESAPEGLVSGGFVRWDGRKMAY